MTRLLIRHSRSTPRSHSLDQNDIGVKGASALAAILKETQITKLRCAAPRSRLCQRPLTRLLSHHHRAPPLTRSIGCNRIGDEGATALAAILKETKITHLGCATAPKCSLLCQRPLARLLSHTVLAPPLTRSLRGNNIGDKGASALAAVLKETMISHLECAAAR